MNSLVKALIQPILEANQGGIALVPGGFKPPTIGHFHLANEVAKRPEIDKVIILIGHKTRDGVTKEESLAIWDIYKKYLPPNVEIKIADNSSPISDIGSLIKNNPDTFFFPVVGIRGEFDLGDLKRFDSMKGKYENFRTIVIKTDEGKDRVSGTNTRNALIGGNKEKFQTYLPTELSDEEKDKVWNILTKTPIQEMYAEPSEHDYPKLIKSLSEYMLDKGMNIRPLPKVKFVEDDIENARNFFGKTAYYDPNKRVIVLYTMERHPKDIMRSFAHEMIHHMQNCDDRLGNITTQDTNEDGDLPEIEREAYEKGNMTFRNWTDTLTESILKEEEESDITSFSSTFKPDVNITVIFKEHKNYKTLKPYFEEYGYGFYYPEDKTIFIDGEVFINSDLTLNDLKFVEAHEITHLLLRHTGPYSEEDEMDADLGAYILLKNKGLSTEKLVKEFKNRHGVDFNEKLLERVKGMLKEQNYIQEYKKYALTELFEKDLPNIEKISPTEYIVGNGTDIEAKYFFKLASLDPNDWEIHWDFTDNNTNISSKSWKQVTATSFKILSDFISINKPNLIEFSGNTDAKTKIYKSKSFIEKLETLFNNQYVVDNSNKYVIYLKKIEEIAKSSIKKRMETLNESYEQSLDYFQNGDINSKSKIERWKSIKKIIERDILKQLYKI